MVTLSLKVSSTEPQPRLKSWRVPIDLGSQHRGACAPRPAKGRAGC